MDGFKNTTKMKYMCGGPVRKATGGMIKSAAPKGLLKSAAGAKIAAKASDLAKKAAPEMAKRQVQPLPPKDNKITALAKKAAKTMGGEPRRSDEGISAKRLLAGTAGDYAAPPEKAKTMGGAPKTIGTAAQAMGAASRDAKTIGTAAQTMGAASRDAKTIGSASPGAKTIGGMTMGKSPTDGLTKSPMGGSPTGPLGSVAKNPPKGGAALSKMAQSVAGAGQKEGPMSGAPKKATASPRGMETLKAVGSVGMPKKGVPVASKKPMIGLKTGGYVSKSSFNW